MGPVWVPAAGARCGPVQSGADSGLQWGCGGPAQAENASSGANKVPGDGVPRPIEGLQNPNGNFHSFRHSGASRRSHSCFCCFSDFLTPPNQIQPIPIVAKNSSQARQNANTSGPKRDSLGPHSTCNQIEVPGASPGMTSQPGKFQFWCFWPVLGLEEPQNFCNKTPKPVNRKLHLQAAKPSKLSHTRWGGRDCVAIPMSPNWRSKSP